MILKMTSRMNLKMNKINLNEFQEKIDSVKSELLKTVNDSVIIRLNNENNLSRLVIIGHQPDKISLGIFHSTEDVKLKNVPLAEGIKIDQVTESSNVGILISLEEGYDTYIFYQFILNITNALSEIENSIELSRNLIKQIKLWTSFFNRRKRPLSENKQLGLIGELLFISEFLIKKVDENYLVNSWEGPNSGLHDFVLKNNNFELKSSIGENDVFFNIHGESQLEDIDPKKLFLVHSIFEKSDDGKHLFDFYNIVLDKLSNKLSKEILVQSMYNYGVRKIHKDFYVEKGLKLNFIKFNFHLIDSNFPSLVPGFAGPAIKVDTYRINSKSCTEFIIDQKSFTDNL